MNMNELEAIAHDLHAACQAARGVIEKMEAEKLAVEEKHRTRLNLHLDAVKKYRAELHQGIDTNRALFAKPKTVVRHGIKFGLRKGPGGIEIADEDKTIALIEKHLAEQAEALIATRKSVVKKALENLDSKDLRQIGVTFSNVAEAVVVKLEEPETAKLLQNLLAAEVVK
jgi:hypothetical protein